MFYFILTPTHRHEHVHTKCWAILECLLCSSIVLASQATGVEKKTPSLPFWSLQSGESGAFKINVHKVDFSINSSRISG